MRTARKRKEAGSPAIMLLLSLILIVALATAIYTINPLGARDSIFEAVGIRMEEGTPPPPPESAQSTAPAPQHSAARETAPDVASGMPSGARLLSQALSKAALPAEAAGDRASVIPAGQAFSFLDWMESGQAGLTEGTASQIASLLMEAALKAGMIVGERYPHRALPDYANPGFDVAVSANRNLKLLNPFPFDIALTLTAVNGKPAVQITGRADDEWSAPQITVKQESFPPDQAVLVDYAGTTPKRGTPGTLIKVYAGTDLLYKDFYSPNEEERLLDPTQEEWKSLNHSGALQEER